MTTAIDDSFLYDFTENIVNFRDEEEEEEEKRGEKEEEEKEKEKEEKDKDDEEKNGDDDHPALPKVLMMRGRRRRIF